MTNPKTIPKVMWRNYTDNVPKLSYIFTLRAFFDGMDNKIKVTYHAGPRTLHVALDTQRILGVDWLCVHVSCVCVLFNLFLLIMFINCFLALQPS